MAAAHLELELKPAAGLIPEPAVPLEANKKVSGSSGDAQGQGWFTWLALVKGKAPDGCGLSRGCKAAFFFCDRSDKKIQRSRIFFLKQTMNMVFIVGKVK